MNQYSTNRFAPYWTRTSRTNNYLFFVWLFWAIFGRLREHLFRLRWTGSRRNKGMKLFLCFFHEPSFLPSKFVLKSLSCYAGWCCCTFLILKQYSFLGCDCNIAESYLLTCHNNVTWNWMVLVLLLTTCLFCVLTRGYGLFFGLAVTWLKPVQHGVNHFTP